MLTVVRSPGDSAWLEPKCASFDTRRRLDEETLELLREGDRTMVESALRALFPEVRSRLFRLLGPRADLDDAVQETLIEVTRALPKFEGRASLATLANRIAVRVAFRYYGKVSSDELDESHASAGDDPEERVSQRQTLDKLYRCLDKLSLKRRVAFVLCAIDGLTPAEAAEIEEVPSLIIRARLMQARNEIARLMRGDPYAEELLRGRDGMTERGDE
jgi:RNA polymerase sigma-70 factor (ECF subfamily)